MSLAVESLRLRRAQYERADLGGRLRALVAKGSGLHLIESGQVLLKTQRMRLELHAGDVVVVPSSTQRTLTPCGPKARAQVLSAELEFAEPEHPLLAGLPATFHVRQAVLATDPHWSSHVASLVDELEPGREGSHALVARLTEVLFIHVLRLSPPPSRAECPSGFLRGLHDVSLQPVLGAMHSAPGHAWTLASLAKLAGQSRSAFAAHFTEAMGEPPMTYLARWRMFRARSLLRESELPLAAIADEVGYGSGAAFSLAFTREHGTSPGAFRAASRRNLTTTAIAYRPAR
jgi:AraC-like DNA-binding protein